MALEGQIEKTVKTHLGGSMNCRDLKDLMVMGIYGTLTESQKKELQDHLDGCSQCARIVEKTEQFRPLLKNNDEIPRPDYEKSWQVISQRLKKRSVSSARVPYTRWALAGAFCIIFVLGIITGRKLFLRGNDDTSSVLSSFLQSDRPLQSYLETLELVRINFMNRNSIDQEEGMMNMEDRILTEMRDQTRLLKQMMMRRNQTEIMKILDEIDFLLIGISNLRPEDQDAAQQLQTLIREKSQILKLRQFTDQTSI
jgi:hypothetical protein